MRACLGAVLVAALLCAATAADQSDFDDLWEDTYSHVEDDVQSIAKSIWNDLCDGCSMSTPSVQHNTSVDPNLVFNFQAPDDCDPALAIHQHYENLIRNYYLGPLMGEAPVGTDDYSVNPNEMYAVMMQTLFPYATSDYGSLLSDYAEPTGLATVETTGGAGMGWGISVYCDQTLLLSTGGGLGAGYDATQSQVVGGAGGGGGLQAFVPPSASNDDPTDDPPSPTLFYNIGGGGGGGIDCGSSGCVNPTWGTNSDPTQLTPAQLWANMSAQATGCYKAGKLSLVGGGGVGGGWTSVDTSSGSIVGNYGGGTGFSFVFTSPTGGVTPPSNNQGVTMGAVVTECLNQCTNQRSQGSGYYACLCPCNKRKFLALGNSWASSISCAVPQ